MAVGKVNVNNPNLQIMFYNAFKAFFLKIPKLNVSVTKSWILSRHYNVSIVKVGSISFICFILHKVKLY